MGRETIPPTYPIAIPTKLHNYGKGPRKNHEKGGLKQMGIERKNDLQSRVTTEYFISYYPKTESGNRSINHQIPGIHDKGKISTGVKDMERWGPQPFISPLPLTISPSLTVQNKNHLETQCFTFAHTRVFHPKEGIGRSARSRSSSRTNPRPPGSIKPTFRPPGNYISNLSHNFNMDFYFGA